MIPNGYDNQIIGFFVMLCNTISNTVPLLPSAIIHWNNKHECSPLLSRKSYFSTLNKSPITSKRFFLGFFFMALFTPTQMARCFGFISQNELPRPRSVVAAKALTVSQSRKLKKAPDNLKWQRKWLLCYWSSTREKNICFWHMWKETRRKIMDIF